MKSIKPGRGPSMMNAVGSLIGIVFGIIWTCAAASMGAPGFFPLFGLVFIGIGVVNAIYSFKNATGDNRYSAYDIVDEDEEPDPLNQRFRPDPPSGSDSPDAPESGDARFCPYCGAPIQGDYAYCPRCGKSLPDLQ